MLPLPEALAPWVCWSPRGEGWSRGEALAGSDYSPGAYRQSLSEPQSWGPCYTTQSGTPLVCPPASKWVDSLHDASGTCAGGEGPAKLHSRGPCHMDPQTSSAWRTGFPFCCAALLASDSVQLHLLPFGEDIFAGYTILGCQLFPWAVTLSPFCCVFSGPRVMVLSSHAAVPACGCPPVRLPSSCHGDQVEPAWTFLLARGLPCAFWTCGFFLSDVERFGQFFQIFDFPSLSLWASSACMSGPWPGPGPGHRVPFPLWGFWGFVSVFTFHGCCLPCLICS